MKKPNNSAHSARGIHRELPRLIGFCLVGGGGFIVHASAVTFFTAVLGTDKLVAWFPAFVLAVTLTWLLNRFLTFRGLGAHRPAGEAIRYFVIESIGASINFAVYAAILTNGAKLLSHPVLALACGAGAAFIFNYTALRFFVFRAQPAAPSMAITEIDDIYYEHAMSVPLARRAAIAARERMFAHFMRVMQPGPDTTILDFGASATETPEANIFEKSYPYPRQITAAGLGDGRLLTSMFSGIAYQQIAPGAPLPFADNSFDIAYSNAVFEHLGSRTAREEILRELRRVAHRVYITTPNRYFPIEHHTAIPLLHYSPRLFRTFTKNGKYEHWSVPQNLQFLSRTDLRNVFAADGEKSRTAYTGLPLGPLSSNIACWTAK